MALYAAFLRGVMPTNAKMVDLKASFEAAGFGGVRTVLSSGNVVFDAPRAASPRSLERRGEKAMQERLRRTFLTIVRSIDELRSVLASDPYRGFRVPPHAKRVVTFFRGRPQHGATFPVELDGARILCVRGGEAFSTYVRSPGARGAVFMALIERTFGEEVTTRTWDTVAKVAG